MKYKITLSDGTVLDNLELNGNNFVSKEEITEETFNGKLSKVTIEGTNEDGKEIKEEHEHMELVQIATYKDVEGYYFILRDIPESELEKIKIQSDIDYLAMMTDIDLEEE